MERCRTRLSTSPIPSTLLFGALSGLNGGRDRLHLTTAFSRRRKPARRGRTLDRSIFTLDRAAARVIDHREGSTGCRPTRQARRAGTAGRQRQAPGGSSRSLGQGPTGSGQRGRRVNARGKPPAGRKTSKRRARLRFEILNAFVDTGMAELSRAELAVWLALYRDTGRDGTARASLDDLARRGGMDRQTASRAVGRLARRKMLQVIRRGGLESRSPGEMARQGNKEEALGSLTKHAPRFAHRLRELVRRHLHRPASVESLQGGAEGRREGRPSPTPPLDDRSRAGSVARSCPPPCPSGEPHLQSCPRVCDPVPGTGLIPTAGAACAVVPISTRGQVSVASDLLATRRAESSRTHRW